MSEKTGESESVAARLAWLQGYAEGLRDAFKRMGEVEQGDGIPLFQFGHEAVGHVRGSPPAAEARDAEPVAWMVEIAGRSAERHLCFTWEEAQGIVLRRAPGGQPDRLAGVCTPLYRKAEDGSS